MINKKWNYLAAIFLTATLLAGTALAQGKGKQETLTGTVTDTMCGAKHSMKAQGQTDKDCAIACVKMGSKYALAVGDKVYELEGKEADLAKFAGAKAKVTGTVDGSKVKVNSISPA